MKTFEFDAVSTDGNVIEINGRKLEAEPAVDGMRLLEFMAVVEDPAALPAHRAQALIKWLKECFGEHYEEFNKVVTELKVDVEGLGEIGGYLADFYAERPTKPDSSSGSGDSTTGPSSEGGSSPSASTTGG